MSSNPWEEINETNDGSWPALDLIPEELIEFIKPELEPGEKILWLGVSQPRKLDGVSTGLRPFLLAISSFGTVLFITFGPLHARFASAEYLFLSIAVPLWLTAIIAWFVAIDRWEAFRARRAEVPDQTYALTDRRAIIWKTRKGTEAVERVAYPVGTIKQVYRMGFPDGSGDVLFDESTNPDGSGVPQGFLGVKDVRKVENMVLQVLVRPGGNR